MELVLLIQEVSVIIPSLLTLVVIGTHTHTRIALNRLYAYSHDIWHYTFIDGFKGLLTFAQSNCLNPITSIICWVYRFEN